MKKTTLLIPFLLASLFLFGCATGKSITLPPGETMAVERSVSGTSVTLEIVDDAALFDPNEIVIIAESIPSTVSYVEGSAVPAPTFNDATLVAWLFARNPPQTLGQLEITEPIPSSITYGVSGAADSQGFVGKWGLKLADLEGQILGGGLGDPFDINGDGIFNELDILTFLDRWLAGQSHDGRLVDELYIIEVLDYWYLQ